MSKQLSISAAVSVIAMAAFALIASTPVLHRADAGAATAVVAHELKAALQG